MLCCAGFDVLCCDVLCQLCYSVSLSAYKRGHKHTGIRTHECTDYAKLNTQLKQRLEAEEDTSTGRKTWQIYLLSLSLSLSFLCLCLCLSLSLSLCLCLSVVSVCQSDLSVCLSLSLSFSLSLSLSEVQSLSVFLSQCLTLVHGLGRNTLQLNVKVMRPSKQDNIEVHRRKKGRERLQKKKKKRNTRLILNLTNYI